MAIDSAVINNTPNAQTAKTPATAAFIVSKQATKQDALFNIFTKINLNMELGLRRAKGRENEEIPFVLGVGLPRTGEKYIFGSKKAT